MKKILTLLLCALLVFSMVACGGDTPPATSSAPQSEAAAPADSGGDEPSDSADEGASAAGGRVIGINNWFEGAYALDILCNNAKFVAEQNGDTCQVFNDEANTEKLITNLENMVAAEVDGVMWMGMFENTLATGPQVPNNAGIYFTFYDKLSTDAAVLQSTREMEFFAGGVGNDNYNAGAISAQAALNDGCTKVLIAGAEIGDPNTDARVNGFVETFEAAGGEVLSVTRVASGEANAEQQACDNMLAAYPNADAFYCTGENFTLAALNVVAKTESDHEIRVYGTDLNPTLLEYLADGSLAACSGAHWVSALYSAILLENAMDGNVLLDDDGLPAIIEDAGFISVPAEFAGLYQRFFIDENPYEAEEIANMMYRNNPDVTLADLREMIANYSLEERLIAKYDAGKVTAEELAEVGIEVG